MSTSFALDVVLSSSDATTSNTAADATADALNRNHRLEEEATQDTAVVYNSSLLRLSQRAASGSDDYYPVVRYAAVFLPSTLVEAALKELPPRGLLCNGGGGLVDAAAPTESAIAIPAPDRRRLSRSVLSMTHPFLAQNFVIKAIISVRNEQHSPADVVLLDLSHTPPAAVAELLEATKGQLIHASDHAILSIILVTRVTFSLEGDDGNSRENGGTNGNVASLKPHPSSFDIPTCPVCLYRIDPVRLGLPKTPIHDLCSKFCPPPNLLLSDEENCPCPRQRLLQPWPLPSRCACCRVIDQYWKGKAESQSELSDLFCCECAMQETLWVCMTCGFLGCGRYSNKHAAQHFADTGHPYSLELATLRIWEYVTGEFAHRPDLLECPTSPPRWHQWMRRAASHDATTAEEDYYPVPTATAQVTTANTTSASLHSSAVGGVMGGAASSATASIDEKSPKKATMIGEEYEALLHSALEEQAQHYEGEITRLLATLTAEHVDTSSMTEEEKATVDDLQSEIKLLRSEIEQVGRDLLAAQAQEAGYRATSQHLLREQQVTQELLKKIQEEMSREQEGGMRQVEELEQQIADLTANQRMRDQFSQDRELSNAQIFGTTSSDSPKARNNKKGGKKPRRLFRNRG